MPPPAEKIQKATNEFFFQRGVSMKRLLYVLLCLITVSLLFTVTVSANPYTADELSTGYMTIIDEKGTIVFQTGLPVHPGDEFINEDNRAYEVTVVEGTLARARFTGEESLVGLLADSVPVQASTDNEPPPLISIYHTHTDESYIPTDGKSSHLGKGTIMKVGDAFGKRLTEMGYRVDHSTNLHDPHDANAYHRSRRTFVKLLEKKPAAIFDIHRDSAPLRVYRTSINGKDAAKILIVVGRQNQNRATTMNYAKTVKAAADSKYRGLVRGIFIAQGNYNQDLSPRTLLLEIGTQYSRREAAEYSITLFADLVPSLVSATAGKIAQAKPVPGNNIIPPSPTAEGWSQDIMLLIGALVAGSAAFLFLSTGSIKEAKAKLKNFTTREFGDVFRLRRKRKD